MSRASAFVATCRAMIDRGALPGRCAGCGVLVRLCLPYGWRDEDGREHRCDGD